MSIRSAGWLLCVVCSVSISCGSAIPPYPNVQTPTSAVVEGDFANFFKFIGAGEGHVNILEVDGKPVNPGWSGKVYLQPGRHVLGIQATGAGYVNARDYAEIDVLAGHKYKLSGNFAGISFILNVHDQTRDPPQLVKTIRLRQGAQQAPPTMIFIPSG